MMGKAFDNVFNVDFFFFSSFKFVFKKIQCMFLFFSSPTFYMFL